MRAILRSAEVRTWLATHHLKEAELVARARRCATACMVCSQPLDTFGTAAMIIMDCGTPRSSTLALAHEQCADSQLIDGRDIAPDAHPVSLQRNWTAELIDLEDADSADTTPGIVVDLFPALGLLPRTPAARMAEFQQFLTIGFRPIRQFTGSELYLDLVNVTDDVGVTIYPGPPVPTTDCVNLVITANDGTGIALPAVPIYPWFKEKLRRQAEVMIIVASEIEQMAGDDLTQIDAAAARGEAFIAHTERITFADKLNW